jgi:hypothetical protein
MTALRSPGACAQADALPVTATTIIISLRAMDRMAVLILTFAPRICHFPSLRYR